MVFTVGTAAGIVFAAIIKFAVLPGVQTFPAFCVAIGVFLVPVGFGMAHSKNPAVLAVVTAMGFLFVPVLQPTNPISYDTVQFYNSSLAIFVGCAVAPLSFRLLPPLSPALRMRRLLRLTLRDLRRLAMGRTQSDWEGHVHCRLSVMPDAATPLQRAQLLAALSAGSEIIRLRQIALGLGPSSTPSSTRHSRPWRRAAAPMRSHVSAASTRSLPLAPALALARKSCCGRAAAFSRYRRS